MEGTEALSFVPHWTCSREHGGDELSSAKWGRTGYSPTRPPQVALPTADNNNTAPKVSSHGFHAKVHVRSGNQPPLLAGLCIDPLASDSLTSAVNAASVARVARVSGVAQTINIPP